MSWRSAPTFRTSEGPASGVMTLLPTGAAGLFSPKGIVVGCGSIQNRSDHVAFLRDSSLTAKGTLPNLMPANPSLERTPKRGGKAGRIRKVVLDNG